MHVVEQISKHQAKDVGVALRHMLVCWENGEVRGLAACLKDAHGQEIVSISGHYREDRAHALSATMKMSRRIQEMQDDEEE